MGEYDAKQRNQLCTLITNGNTRSKQLKVFVDNRCTTQTVASQLKVIQRVTIEDWCNGVREASNPTITLYTHIIDDGFGDAGQLGYLVDKVLPLGYNTIPYATYRGPRKPSDIKKILDLSRIKNKKYLKEKAGAGWISEINDNTWEIQYPVPMHNNKIEERKVLKIWEMGQGHLDSLSGYNTGIGKLPDTTPRDVHNPIGGYGVPQYVSNPKDEKELEEKLREFGITLDSSSSSSAESKDSYSSLKDAWLVKVNKEQSVDTILGKAKEKGCTLLILLGGKNVKTAIEESANKPDKVYYIPSLKQSVLSCLMSKIGCDGGTGMIFAGGEGMYVQALGASEAAVGDVTRGGGYSTQTRQIFADLIIGKSKLKTDPDSFDKKILADDGLSLAELSRFLGTLSAEFFNLEKLLSPALPEEEEDSSEEEEDLPEEEEDSSEEEEDLPEEEEDSSEEEEDLPEEEEDLPEEEEDSSEEEEDSSEEFAIIRLDYLLSKYKEFLNLPVCCLSDIEQLLMDSNLISLDLDSILKKLDADPFPKETIQSATKRINPFLNKITGVIKTVRETLTLSNELEKNEISNIKNLFKSKVQLPEIESKLPEIESKLPEIESKLPEVESKLSEVESKLSEIKGKLPEIKDKLSEIKDKLSRLLGCILDFNPYEPLGMMDIPKEKLKAHSDWLRQPEHNWFNKLIVTSPK